MGNKAFSTYCSKMDDVLREFKNLPEYDRKDQDTFIRYIRKETEVFIEILKDERFKNISTDDYDRLLQERTKYVQELTNAKYDCTIF